MASNFRNRATNWLGSTNNISCHKPPRFCLLCQNIVTSLRGCWWLLLDWFSLVPLQWSPSPTAGALWGWTKVRACCKGHSPHDCNTARLAVLRAHRILLAASSPGAAVGHSPLQALWKSLGCLWILSCPDGTFPYGVIKLLIMMAIPWWTWQNLFQDAMGKNTKTLWITRSAAFIAVCCIILQIFYRIALYEACIPTQIFLSSPYTSLHCEWNVLIDGSEKHGVFDGTLIVNGIVSWAWI